MFKSPDKSERAYKMRLDKEYDSLLDQSLKLSSIAVHLSSQIFEISLCLVEKKFPIDPILAAIVQDELRSKLKAIDVYKKPIKEKIQAVENKIADYVNRLKEESTDIKTISDEKMVKSAFGQSATRSGIYRHR